MKLVCECNSIDCKETIDVELDTVNEFEKHYAQGHCFISSKCLHGPEPTDELITTHDDFSIYNDTDV